VAAHLSRAELVVVVVSRRARLVACDGARRLSAWDVRAVDALTFLR
jgi:hypothetical protein